MNSVIKYFIKYPVAGNMLMLVTILFGWFGLQSLKSNFFPVFDARQITINVTYPGASPEEIEEGIVLKIEDNLKGITGIDRVMSVSSENSALITVEVLKGANTYKVLQDVKNAVDRISSFPVGMEPPVIANVERIDRAIGVAIYGNVDLRTLKRKAREIENDLRGVDGISQLVLSGFPEEEIEIALSENALRAYDLTFTEVANALKNSNLEATGGIIKGSEEELLIRADNKYYYGKDLKDIVIRSNPRVYLSDVASITDRWSDNPNRSYYNGKPAVMITVNNTVDEDILFITDYVKKYFEEFNKENVDIKSAVTFDMSETLTARIDLLVNNGIIGALLVVLFLAMFLNTRLAFWVALGIPISFMGMFIIASLYGLTINVISLFGMILVVGILVDDGIVIAENIYQHYERGKSRLQAAMDGTMEVLPAVVSAILTTVAGFSAFFFLDGRMGEFIVDMAFVVIATLLFSLVEAAYILPGHIAHSKALSPDTKPNRVERFTLGIFEKVKRKVYEPVLVFAIQNKFFTVCTSVALILLALGAIGGGLIKTTFFPAIERDDVSVALEMPAGTPETITNARLKLIEEKVWEVNEELKAGRPDSLDVIQSIERSVGPGTNAGTLKIGLLEGEIRNLSGFIVNDMIRKRVGPMYDAQNLSYEVRAAFGKPVSVSLLGNDLQLLEKAKEELKAELSELSSVKDVVDSDKEGMKEINVVLKEKALMLGLRTGDIINQVRQGFFGAEVQRLQRGLDEVRVWVRYNRENRSDMGYLESMRIRTPDGGEYPLSELAGFEIKRGITAINHLDGRREVKIEADIANPQVSATEINAEITDIILPPILKKYPGISYSFEGQIRESGKVGKSVGIIMPIILVLIVTIVAFTFRSFTQTAALFFVIPFGFIGVALGHYIHGAAISILSGYGMIALIGVMINDSLVFVSAFNGLLKEGKTYDEAMYEAGLSRFRPIILTSLTTICGLAPLILERSIQAQFLIPMAISVAYGLLVATFTTLILLPVFLILFNRLKVYLIWLWEGQKPSPEDVEAAVKELKDEQAI